MENPISLYIAYFLSLVPKNLSNTVNVQILENKATIVIDEKLNESDYSCIMDSIEVLFKYSKIKNFSSNNIGDKTYIEFKI